LIVRLLQDARVPLFVRAIPFFGLLYLVSPIDLLTDIALPLGLLDDVVAIIAALTLFMILVPQHIVREQLSWMEAAEITIDDLRQLQEDQPLPSPWEEDEE
jgi:uncharacterized membrane protein YkvA (DUF1232 family)